MWKARHTTQLFNQSDMSKVEGWGLASLLPAYQISAGYGGERIKKKINHSTNQICQRLGGGSCPRHEILLQSSGVYDVPNFPNF